MFNYKQNKPPLPHPTPHHPTPQNKGMNYISSLSTVLTIEIERSQFQMMKISNFRGYGGGSHLYLPPAPDEFKI